MNRTDTRTEFNRLQHRVDQDDRARTRRGAVAGAAAVTAAAVGVGALWFGFQQADPAPPTASPADVGSPSAAAPSESSAAPEDQESPQVPGSSVEGFAGMEGFPMTFVVPAGFSESYEGGGTRAYTIDGTSGGAGAFLVSSLARSEAGDLPADLARHVRRNRDDLIVTDVSTTEVGGRPAQAFTLTQQPGTAPSDLWCVRGGSCFKLLEHKPMDITAVRSGRGLVLFTVEYLPEDRTKAREGIRAWLESVRWE